MPPKTPKKSNEASEVVVEPTTPAPVTSTVDEPITPANMKVTELRDALTARGLSPKGLKKELVERLEEAIKSGPSNLSESTSSQEASVAQKDNASSISEKEEEQVDYSHEEKPAEVKEVKKVGDNIKQKEEPKAQQDKEPKKDTAKDTSKTIQQDNDKSSSSILHVTGFVRPFAVQSAKDLFTSHGPLKTFWMDSIKSFCFAEFETESAASECFTALNGLEFPSGFGKKLAARFATEEAMKEAQEKDTSAKRRASESVSEDAKRQKTGKSLDELFRKTAAKPHLYYLPAKP